MHNKSVDLGFKCHTKISLKEHVNHVASVGIEVPRADHQRSDMNKLGEYEIV